MKEFFINSQNITNFQLFGWFHITTLLVVLIGIFVIYQYRFQIQNLSEKTKRKITIFIVLVMFLNMKIFYITKIIYGAYYWETDLPLHFCYISGYLFMYALLFKKERLYKVVYFFTFIGPLPAMIWTELYGTFDVYVFYQFYISHHFFFSLI